MCRLAALALVLLAACGGGGSGGAPTAVPSADPVALRFETAHFRVFSDQPEDALLRSVADRLEAERPRILADLGLSDAPVIAVRVWRDPAAWSQALAAYFGRTFTSNGYVTGPGELRVLAGGNVQTNAVHEMAHCLSLLINPNFGNSPRWLWESVAIYEAGELVDPRTLPDLVAGRPPTLAQLDADITVGQAVYSVGYTITEFILARGGQAALVALIRSHGDTAAVLGLSAAQFEAAWYAFVRARYLS